MEKIISEAKTFEEAYEKLLNENNLEKENVLYTKETIKGKLFKSDLIKITAYTKETIISEIKKYLKEICQGLNIDVSFEVKTKEERTTIKMFSENNPILIGKNGQTIKALETMVKQYIHTKAQINYKINLDVENYRDKKEARLIRLAKQTAKEVIKTKIEVRMENMNSFERRIIHNALTNFNDITSISEGEEPNRHIVIKIKEN